MLGWINADKIHEAAGQIYQKTGRADTQAPYQRHKRALPYGDIKKLQGRGGYRLRVGDFRIIFDSDGNVILIIRIDSRGQIYKE